MQQEKLSLERRKAVLDGQIAKYSKKGYRVVSRTDTAAQLVRPKQFSCLLATLSFLVIGIGFIIYVFYCMGQKDHSIYLSIDEYGKVRKR